MQKIHGLEAWFHEQDIRRAKGDAHFHAGGGDQYGKLVRVTVSPGREPAFGLARATVINAVDDQNFIGGNVHRSEKATETSKSPLQIAQLVIYHHDLTIRAYLIGNDVLMGFDKFSQRGRRTKVELDIAMQGPPRITHDLGQLADPHGVNTQSLQHRTNR